MTSRSVPRTRIRSTAQYVADLVSREPALANAGLNNLPSISITSGDAYNAINAQSMTEAVVRVSKSFLARTKLGAALLQTLIKNLTSEATTVGFAAQFQGYDWLLRQGASFTPEVEHAGTLRGTQIALDGRFEARHGGSFFDIKSYAFEPGLRGVFKQRLETLIGGGVTVTIDGPGNHAPDAIQEHAFGELRKHVGALKSGQVVRIIGLQWTLTAHKRCPGVLTSTASYDPTALAHQHRLMPLWYASQFTIDVPYILIFVLPYGFGGNPFSIDVFGSGVQVFDSIASHVFGPGRSDGCPASAYDNKMPADVTVAKAVACLSGLALLSEPGSGHPTTARIHLNGAAINFLTTAQAASISPTWTIVPHP